MKFNQAEGLAVKVLPLVGLTASQLAKVQGEFNIQRTLSAACPGVVLAVEAWRTSKEMFMVMEKMGGGELAGDSSAKPPVPPVSAAGDVNQFLKLAKQMVAALKCVHAQGYVHRDVKTQNWLLSTDHQTVKLADFGESFDSAHAASLLTSTLKPWDQEVTSHATSEYRAPSAHGPAPAYTELPVSTFTFARRKEFDSYGLGLSLLSFYYGDSTLGVVAGLKGSALGGYGSALMEEVALWKSEAPAAVAARFAAYDTAKQFKPMPPGIRTFILEYLFEIRTPEHTDLARMPFGHWSVSRGSWVPPAGVLAQ